MATVNRMQILQVFDLANGFTGLRNNKCLLRKNILYEDEDYGFIYQSFNIL